jgi:hypothetical protein
MYFSAGAHLTPLSDTGGLHTEGGARAYTEGGPGDLYTEGAGGAYTDGGLVNECRWIIDATRVFEVRQAQPLPPSAPLLFVPPLMPRRAPPTPLLLFRSSLLRECSRCATQTFPPSALVLFLSSVLSHGAVRRAPRPRPA